MFVWNELVRLLQPHGLFLASAAAFTLLELYMPRVRRLSWRRGWLTDWTFALLNGTVVVGAVGAATSALSMSVIGLFGPPEFRWAQALPLWLQVVLFIVVGDFVFYWEHRLFHRVGRLWAFHKVHHSSRELDWLSAVRQHPFDLGVTLFGTASFLALLGFSAECALWAQAFYTVNEMWTHSNLPVRLPLLRYVLVTPETHRWHHSEEPADHNERNLAAVCAFWDALFGTLYYPRDRTSTGFGIAGEPAFCDSGFLAFQIEPLRALKSRT